MHVSIVFCSICRFVFDVFHCSLVGPQVFLAYLPFFMCACSFHGFLCVFHVFLFIFQLTFDISKEFALLLLFLSSIFNVFETLLPFPSQIVLCENTRCLRGCCSFGHHDAHAFIIIEIQVSGVVFIT